MTPPTSISASLFLYSWKTISPSSCLLDDTFSFPKELFLWFADSLIDDYLPSKSIRNNSGVPPTVRLNKYCLSISVKGRIILQLARLKNKILRIIITNEKHQVLSYEWHFFRFKGASRGAYRASTVFYIFGWSAISIS